MLQTSSIRTAPKADRTTADGIVFDSKSEMKRWLDLRLLEKAGEISGLERQRVFTITIDGRPAKIRSERYPNGRICTYTVDFAYIDKRSGNAVYEEHKGRDMRDARLRRAVVEMLYGIEITVTGDAAAKTPRKTTPKIRGR